MRAAAQWATRFADLDKNSIPMVAFGGAVPSDARATNIMLARRSTIRLPNPSRYSTSSRSPQSRDITICHTEIVLSTVMVSKTWGKEAVVSGYEDLGYGPH